MASDRRIIWHNPDLPAFCTMPNSREADITNPLSVQGAVHCLQRIALSAGVLDHVTTHDVRRGALRDISHSSNIPGTSRETVVRFANHSNPAMMNGVTDRYTEIPQIHVYSERVSLGFEDRKGPAFSANPPTHRPEKAAVLENQSVHGV